KVSVNSVMALFGDDPRRIDRIDRNQTTSHQVCPGDVVERADAGNRPSHILERFRRAGDAIAKGFGRKIMPGTDQLIGGPRITDYLITNRRSEDRIDDRAVW